MPEAAKRLGVGSNDTAKRALQNADVPMVRINGRAWAVEEGEVEKLRLAREAAGYVGRGRPAGTFKPESPRSKAHKAEKSDGESAST